MARNGKDGLFDAKVSGQVKPRIKLQLKTRIGEFNFEEVAYEIHR